MASFVECENASCPNYPEQQTFPSDKALWIDGTFTVCSEACREQFLEDHPRVAETLLYEPHLPPISRLQSLPPQEEGLLRLLRNFVARKFMP